MGANVGINILSFLIIWGFELYLKFAQGRGTIEKPKKKKPKPETENQDKNTETPDNESETQKAETFEDQRFQSETEKIVSKKPTEIKSEKETGTILQLKHQFFPYEKHVRNARQSFRRAFDESRKPATVQNRMATAQQHINVLLFEGFNAWVDSKIPSLLRFDKLKNPILKAKSWEAIVKIKNGQPSLEKFEIESGLNQNLGEVG